MGNAGLSRVRSGLQRLLVCAIAVGVLALPASAASTWTSPIVFTTVGEIGGRIALGNDGLLRAMWWQDGELRFALVSDHGYASTPTTVAPLSGGFQGNAVTAALPARRSLLMWWDGYHLNLETLSPTGSRLHLYALLGSSSGGFTVQPPSVVPLSDGGALACWYREPTTGRESYAVYAAVISTAGTLAKLFTLPNGIGCDVASSRAGAVVEWASPKGLFLSRLQAGLTLSRPIKLTGPGPYGPSGWGVGGALSVTSNGTVAVIVFHACSARPSCLDLALRSLTPTNVLSRSVPLEQLTHGEVPSTFLAAIGSTEVMVLPTNKLSHGWLTLQANPAGQIQGREEYSDNEPLDVVANGRTILALEGLRTSVQAITWLGGGRWSTPSVVYRLPPPTCDTSHPLALCPQLVPGDGGGGLSINASGQAALTFVMYRNVPQVFMPEAVFDF